MELLDDIFSDFEEYVPTAKSKAVEDNRTPTERFIEECGNQRKLIDDPECMPTSYMPLEGGKKGERAKDEKGNDIPKTFKSCWYREADQTFQVMVGVKALTKRYKGLSKEDAHNVLTSIENKAKNGDLDEKLNEFDADAKKAAGKASEARAKASLIKYMNETNLKAAQRKRMNELIKEYGHPNDWDD